MLAIGEVYVFWMGLLFLCQGYPVLRIKGVENIIYITILDINKFILYFFILDKFYIHIKLLIFIKLNTKGEFK